MVLFTHETPEYPTSSPARTIGKQPSSLRQAQRSVRNKLDINLLATDQAKSARQQSSCFDHGKSARQQSSSSDQAKSARQQTSCYGPGQISSTAIFLLRTRPNKFDSKLLASDQAKSARQQSSWLCIRARLQSCRKG